MQLTNARAWLQATDRWSEEDQEAAVRDWCDAHLPQCAVVIYRASTHKRASFIRAVRASEVAVLPALHVLMMRDGVTAPSVDFAAALSALQSKSARVVDARRGVASDVSAEWRAAIAAEMKLLKSGGGRKIDKREARRMQRESVRTRNKDSVIARWRSDPKLIARWRPVYRSYEFGNFREAQLALPTELHTVSRSSLDRLFGGRTKKKRRKPE